MNHNTNQKHKGILLILTSALCFAGMNIFIRLSGDIPTMQKSFFRNFIAMMIAAFIILREGKGFRPVDKRNLPILLGRACFGTLGILANYYAVDHLLLSDASMLNKMAPFFAVLASIFILKEKLSPAQGLTLAGAFTGALFIIKPTFSNLHLIPALIGLAGGLCAGTAYTLVRLLGQRGERSSFIVFFFSTFSCLTMLPKLLFDYAPMTLRQTLFLLAAGLCAAGGQFSVTGAYRHAPAREISVYDYSQVIFSAVMGFFLFGDVPDMFSFVGYFLICGMAVLNFLYNNGKLSRRASS